SEYTSQAYSAVLKAKLGAFDVTSLTGYGTNRARASLDFSFAFAPNIQQTRTAYSYVQSAPTHRFSEELRASTRVGENWEALVGAYYSHERLPSQAFFHEVDATTGEFQRIYAAFIDDGGRVFTEYAGFADLTYRISDRLDIQLGARESHSRLSV